MRTCQEDSGLSSEKYIACGRPATRVVYSPRDKREYDMCDMCSHHNIKNRGFEDRGEIPHEGSPGGCLSFLEEDEYNDDPTNSELAEISALAKMQIALEDLIAEMKVKVAEKEAELKKLVEVTIPNAMDAVSMSAYSLDTGESVTIKPDVFASIYAAKTEEAADWMEKNGFGDSVKDKIEVQLMMGQRNIAPEFLKLAIQLGVSASEKLTVHPGTLKSLVKEQREKGVEFPSNLFSIHDVKKSIIKRPKVKK